MLCFESLIPLAGHLTKEENQVHTLGTLLQVGEDKSWKVRLCFAKNFARFAESFGKEITDNNLIQTFTLLLNDNEPEVKNAAITSLSNSLKNLSTEKICNLILPTLQNSYADAQTQFKAGVALSLCEMSNIVGKECTLTRVMPILTELLKDENADVRLNACQNMSKLGDVIGVDMLSPNFTSILTNMTQDAQWRVRMSVFELIGDLSLKFGKDIFLKSLEVIFMQYLNNSAAAVREMGIQKSKEIAEQFKSDWVLTNFVPKVVANYDVDKKGYNYRMCALESLSVVMPLLQKDAISDKIVPTLLKACSDKVPNVQFCVSRIIQKQMKYIDQAVMSN